MGDIVLISRGEGEYFITSNYTSHGDTITAKVRAVVKFNNSEDFKIDIILPQLKFGVLRDRLHACPPTVKEKYLQLLEQNENSFKEQKNYMINGKII